MQVLPNMYMYVRSYVRRCIIQLQDILFWSAVILFGNARNSFSAYVDPRTSFYRYRAVLRTYVRSTYIFISPCERAKKTDNLSH